jgi:hypothetical protein
MKKGWKFNLNALCLAVVHLAPQSPQEKLSKAQVKKTKKK